MIPPFFEEVAKKKGTFRFPRILVGTQMDKKRVVTRKQGKDLAKQWNCLFWETSAKTGENVKALFKGIIHEFNALK